MKYYKIGFVGAGNLAWHLAQDLEKAGHFIPVVFSRNEENAQILAAQLYDTKVAESLDFSEYDLDLLILAVSDDAIIFVAENIVVQQETVVVHTSGAKSIEVLAGLGDDYGVLYPVQTFTKEKAVNLSEVPFCIEAINTRVHDVLFDIAKSISPKIEVMTSEQRRVLHLAAVFTNNFTNHMLFWAKTLLDVEDMDFNLLKPLAKETIEKAFVLSPDKAQTGPASRGDFKTMKEHLTMIEANPELTAFYQLVSKSIQINS